MIEYHAIIAYLPMVSLLSIDLLLTPRDAGKTV
jgi:hypothetical protein